MDLQQQHTFDLVNHPPHYTTGSVECIEALRAALGEEGFKGYCSGNAIKYLWRFQRKNGEEDIKKATWYCQKLLEVLNEGPAAPYAESA